MAPKRKRSGSSFEEADAAKVEKQVAKDQLENALHINAKNDEEESENSTQLCKKCENMTKDGDVADILTSLSGYLHYSKLGLENSAKRGCESCILLWAETSGPGDWGLPWYVEGVGGYDKGRVNAINALGVPIITPLPSQRPSNEPLQAADIFVGQNKLDSLRFQRPSSNEHSFPAIEMAITADEGK